MFWKLTIEETADAQALDHVDGRFILHRHSDPEGPHLDLRLEMDGYLMGWRVDALSLEGGPWATEKAPHALRWLDHDADAACVDAGLYMLKQRAGDEIRTLLLKGKDGVKQLRIERADGLPASVARDIVEAARESNVSPAEAGRLVRDGLSARRRAVERLCGLGRELDGEAFNVDTWRTLLAGLSLEEIHGQLRAYEVRFDQKYPPLSVSQPERLDEKEVCTGAALSIARE